MSEQTVAPEKETSQWNSRKLFVVLLSQAIAGWMGHEDAFEGLYLCLALTAPAVIYLGGQSLIDAVEKFATSKYGQSPPTKSP